MTCTQVYTASVACGAVIARTSRLCSPCCALRRGLGRLGSKLVAKLGVKVVATLVVGLTAAALATVEYTVWPGFSLQLWRLFSVRKAVVGITLAILVGTMGEWC